MVSLLTPNEAQVKLWLAGKFKNLLEATGHRQKNLALEIDYYAAGLIEREEQLRFSKELWEALYACLDLHHWGEKNSLSPSLTKKAIREIIRKWDSVPGKKQSTQSP